ncbi:NAD(+) synthetase [bacterium]|nr:MAG: NAD(+) synthetase [bacterium]
MSPPSNSPDFPDWAFAPAAATGYCVDFIRDTLQGSGHRRLVVGLSGGIDSAVAAGLAVRAVGADQVTGLMLPYTTSSPASLTDARAVAGALDMKVETVDITPMVDAFGEDLPDADALRRGNIMARCRMIVLYDRSAAEGALVLGTGNRTEGLLGYTTLYGDNACGLNPLGQLYKTEIRLLADFLDLPRVVLDKAPSADLWQGQADEDELGFTYAQADAILHALVDEGLGLERVAALGHAPELVQRIAARMAAMTFKRISPPVALLPGRRDPDGAAHQPAVDGGFH